jgi:hypothetical protein
LANGDPQAWLADVLARLPDHLANKVADLLPWNWKANQQCKAAVAAPLAADHRAAWVLAGRVRLGFMTYRRKAKPALMAA